MTAELAARLLPPRMDNRESSVQTYLRLPARTFGERGRLGTVASLAAPAARSREGDLAVSYGSPGETAAGIGQFLTSDRRLVVAKMARITFHARFCSGAFSERLVCVPVYLTSPV